MRLMVMAGTSDAAILIKRLKNIKNDIHITATTVTSYGAEIAKSAGADAIICQPLPKDQLTINLIKGKIDILVDATHPFAAEATRNAIKASKETEITYFRLERTPTVLPESPLIHQVASFSQAAYLAQKISNDRVLHLAGVSTLHHLTEFIDTDRIVVRVLPTPYSIKKCLELGLPGENIIAMQGTFSREFNQALMMEYGAEVVVTKDSGEIGGTPSKIEAALELGIPVIIVSRPEVPELKKEKVSSSVDELLEELVFFK